MKKSIANSKFGELFITLGKKEKADLYQFMRMPSLKLKAYEILVFEYLVENSDRIEWGKFSQMDIIRALPDMKTIIEKNWNYITSKLHAVIQKYLIMQLAGKNSLLLSPALLQYFSINNLYKNHRSHLKRSLQLLERNNSSSDYYLHKYRLSKIPVMQKRYNRKQDVKFQSHLKYLDNFYLDNRLRLLCEQLNRGLIVNSDYFIGNKELLARQFEPNKSSSYAVRSYYNIFLMFINLNDGDQYYFRARSLLKRCQRNSVSSTDQRSILEYLLNYCIFCLNKLRREAAHEYISLINFAEKNFIILEQGKISPHRYKNVISSYLIIQKNQLAREFAQKYAAYLAGSNTEHILMYNLANIALHDGDARQALNIISHFQPFDFYYKIGYEKLLLKIYFELGDDEAIRTRIKSFAAYVNTKLGIPPNIKSLLQKFIILMKSLINKEYKRVEMLKNELPLTDSQWLKQKKWSDVNTNVNTTP